MFSSNKLSESLLLYKKVFVNAIDSSIIFDRDGNVGYINDALLKLSDYSSKDLQGKSVEFLVSDEEKDRVKNIIGEVLDKKSIFRDFSSFLETKKGRIIPIALTLIPLLEKKKLVGGLAVLVDIRQLEGLLQSLDKAKSELEKRVRERTKDLKERTLELGEAKKTIEEARDVLEIKVKARTIELKDLNKSLEEKVGQRTEELQKKVDELNKWYRLTVGRELRMVELKKEIEKLKRRKKDKIKDEE